MRHSKLGHRVRVVAGQLAGLHGGKEGTFINYHGTQQGWPFVIRLDSGETIELDDWHFEFLGPAAPGMVPPAPQPSQPGPTESEVKTEKKAPARKAAATTASAERVALKREAEPTKRVPLKKPVARREPIKRERVKDTRARTPAKAPAKKPVATKLKMPWPTAILKVLDGRKKVKMQEIYAGVRKLIGERNGPNFTATVRQCIQSMQKQGLTKMERPGVWSATAKGTAKA